MHHFQRQKQNEFEIQPEPLAMEKETVNCGVYCICNSLAQSYIIFFFLNLWSKCKMYFMHIHLNEEFIVCLVFRLLFFSFSVFHFILVLSVFSSVFSQTTMNMNNWKRTQFSSKMYVRLTRDPAQPLLAMRYNMYIVHVANVYLFYNLNNNKIRVERWTLNTERERKLMMMMMCDMLRNAIWKMWNGIFA